jgi:hypothetical protein
MSSSDELELTPAQLLNQLVELCSIAEPETIAAASIAHPWDWDRFQENVAELYACNLQETSRRELAAVPYHGSWSVLLRRAYGLLPLSADVASNGGKGPARALALSRLFTIIRNLCTDASFQQHLRIDHVNLLTPDSISVQYCVSLVRGMERALAHSVAVKETSLLLKSLLQVWANMLTPLQADLSASSAVREDETAAWRWLNTSMRSVVLGPVLRLHLQLPEIASIITGIVHHALLLSDSAGAYLSTDLTPSARTALEEFLLSDVEGTRLTILMLEVSMHSVEAQMESMDAESMKNNSNAIPATVWDWKPQQRDPAWILHIIGLACRATPRFLTELQPRVGAQQWLLLLRLMELWSELLQSHDTLEEEMKQKITSQASISSLEHTAESIAGNMACLVSWLQTQPRQPLPVAPSALPAADTSAVTCNPTPTTTIGIDCASNAVLNILGHVFLLESWSGTIVLTRLREGLLKLNAPSMLLEMLSAADTLDGGTMFSPLYGNNIPAGHTRHTKSSNDPKAYVNQFADHAVTTAAAAAAAASSSPTLPVAPSDVLVRSTPYLFKSNIIRLISSLCHHNRSWQDALGGPAVYACMNHSVLDDWNPLMREYSVLALRNLLEGHEENQKIVSQLRMEGIANKEQLQQNGIEADIDPNTGKVRVATSNKNKQEQPDS